MTKVDIVIAFVIHILIPAIGTYFFLRLRKKMIKENLSNPPIIDLFLIFITYGGLLLVLLTALFWKWSGMASLGIFYLILFAPVVMAYIVERQRRHKTRSKFSKLTYNLAHLYFAIAPAIFFIIYIIE